MNQQFETGAEKPPRSAELLGVISDSLTALANKVVANHEEINHGMVMQTADFRGLGTLGWLQIHHELQLRVAQPDGVELDLVFAVEGTADNPVCSPVVDDPTITKDYDRAFKISTLDQATGQPIMYWVNQSTDRLQAIACADAPALPTDELEAYAALSAAFARQAGDVFDHK